MVDDGDLMNGARCERVLCTCVDCSQLSKRDIKYLAQSQGSMFKYCTASKTSAVKVDKLLEKNAKCFLHCLKLVLGKKLHIKIKTNCNNYMLTMTKLACHISLCQLWIGQKDSAGKAIEALVRAFFLDQVGVDSFLCTDANSSADKNNVQAERV